MSMEIDEFQSLQFSETLSGSQKAPELTRKLKDLHEQLKSLEQGSTEKKSLRAAADQLVHKQILEHSNGTIKILAAICIADIFRLYAPDPPYNNANLKKVFAFFSAQLSLFEKINNTYEYRFYLLESLSTVKSIIIVADLNQNQAEEITSSYFFNFFKVSANKDVGNNVKLGMTEVLIQIIEEVGIFSQDCVELILEQFGKYDKESTEGPYQMAYEICRSCPNVIQRRVCQYFADIIAAVGRSNLSDEDIEELKKAHELIRKVYAIMPELLLNVLPQLQDEMLSEDDNVRDVVTETIGQMFADSQSHLMEQYPGLWREWLGRRNDKSLRLRLKWLDMVEEVAVRHPDLVSEINDCLKGKLADPEEKVRASTCKVVGQLQSRVIDIKHMNKHLLETIAERARDKKASVRKAATDAIGAIYNHFFDQLNERNVMDKLGWIPSILLNGLYSGDLSITVAVEGALQKYILPEEHDDAERVDRLVTVVGSLDSKAKTAFTAIVTKQKSFMESMQKYVEMCEANNVDEHQRLKNEEYMKYLAAHFPDRARTYNSLLAYTSICTKKNIKMLKTSINPDSEYKVIIKAKTSFLEELNETDGAVAEIFTAILNKASLTILNKSCIPELLRLTQSTRGRRAASNQKATDAMYILRLISENHPIMYKSIQKDLTQNIVNGNAVDESLEIFAENCKSANKKVKLDRDFASRLVDFVHEGTYLQAEHASIILAHGTGVVNVTNQLIQSLIINLELGFPRLNILLHALGQFALYCPEALDKDIDSLIYFVEKDLLTGPSPECKEKDNKLWCSFDELPLLSQEKVIGVLLLVNYLTGCMKFPGSSQEQSDLIFPILWSLLDQSTATAIADGILAAESSHLRHHASLALVRLTEVEKYGAQLTITKFEKLALVAQDSCFIVRREFVQYIITQLTSEQLHCRYSAALFLLAYEPEAALVKQVKKFTHDYLLVPGREKMLSVVLTHLIHLVAHHPDFSVGIEELDHFSQYFKYFIACVVTSTNVSLLYHTAQRIKISSDTVNESLSQNSYVLADLLCLHMRTKCKDANWPLNAYGERIQLHPKLYRPLASNAVQNETLKTSFLPTAYTDKIEELQNQKIGEKRIRALAVSSGKRPKL